MTAWIVHQRTGAKTGPFDSYVAAAVFRRDVLRPRLAADSQCQYAIRTDDAEQADVFGLDYAPPVFTPRAAYHAPDCGGTCDGCGWIDDAGHWHPGPCPEGERGAQLERAGGA